MLAEVEPKSLVCKGKSDLPADWLVAISNFLRFSFITSPFIYLNIRLKRGATLVFFILFWVMPWPLAVGSGFVCMLRLWLVFWGILSCKQNNIINFLLLDLFLNLSTESLLMDVMVFRFGPVNLFWSTRYDKAMTLFLACLKDFADFAKSKDQENNIPPEKCFKLPYK